MYLCASVSYVGKTLDHGKVLALLCVPELEFRMHTQFSLFHPMASDHCDYEVKRLEHLINTLLAPPAPQR